MKPHTIFLLGALSLQAQMPGSSNMAWQQQQMQQQSMQMNRMMQQMQAQMRQQQMQQQMQHSQMMAEQRARQQRQQAQAELKLTEQVKAAGPALGEAREGGWTFEKPSGVAWRLPAPSGGQSPTFDGARLLVALENQAVRCLDMANGSTLWENKVPEGLACDPILEGDRVLCATKDYRLLVWEAATGKVQQDIQMDRWSSFALSGLKNHRKVTAPLVEGGRLLIATYGKNAEGSADGKLHAYDLSSGAKLWEYPLAGGPDLDPVIVGGKVLIGGAGHLFGINLADGKLAWYFKTDSSMNTSLDGALALGGGYYFFNGSTLYAVDAAKGVKLWTKHVSDVSSGVLGEGGVLLVKQTKMFMGSTDWLVALDAKTGDQLWERKMGGLLFPWIEDGKVYCNSNEKVLTLDLATGKPSWTVKLPGDPELPVFPLGGLVFAVTHDDDLSTLHALDAKDGKTRWTFAFKNEVGNGLLMPYDRGFLFPGKKGEIITLR